jgi:hypothetical protein
MTAENRWTMQAPTEPGFYWGFVTVLPEILEVVRAPISGVLGVCSLGDETWHPLTEGWVSAWWPDPMVAPEGWEHVGKH